MKFSYYVTLMCWAVFLLPADYSHAQVQNEADISPGEMRTMLNANRIPVHRAVNVEGSPYFFEDFYEGAVFLANGRSTRSVPIRYNTYSHSLDFMSGSQTFSAGLENIHSFEFTADGEIFRFSKGFEASGISEEDVVEVAAEGNSAVFIVRHHTSLIEDAASYGTATRQDKYITSETFYIKTGDGEFNRIRRPNNRRIIRSFPDFGDELERYADEHNLDLSTKKDVARLAAYYNTLAE